MKILIAGFGSIGRRHLHNLISLGEENIILLRSNQSTLDDTEINKYPVETDISAALAHQPDAVIIANPTALHLDVAIPAAKQGCHILLEKPVSNSMDRIDLLRQSAVESGSRIMVAFQYRYHPGLKQVKKWIQQEMIGQIYYFRAHCGEYLPDWHPWEDYRESYSARKDLGGGVLLTLSHPVDYLRWLFGDVENVSANLGQGNILGIEVEEQIDAFLRFQDGLGGGLHLDYLQRPPEHKLEIFGSEGTICWRNDGALRIYQVKNKVWETFSVPEGYSRNDLFLTEMKEFLQVVTGGNPSCSLNDGIEVQKIIMAIYKAAETGTIVSAQ